MILEVELPLLFCLHPPQYEYHMDRHHLVFLPAHGRITTVLSLPVCSIVVPLL
jgi:hypothetical protein